MISDWILIKFKQSHLFHFFGNRIYCLEKQETGEKYDFSHRIQSLVKIDTFGSDELKRKKTRNYVKRRARGRTYQRKKFVKITDEWSHGQKSQRDSEKNKNVVGLELIEVSKVWSLLMLTSWYNDSLVNITNLSRSQKRAPDWSQSLSVMTEWLTGEWFVTECNYSHSQRYIIYI